MGDLSGLFDPARVAVVGASEREGSVGRALMENLDGFAGDLLPVNPGRETVLGYPCYPDLTASPVEGPEDLVVVAVPASAAVDVIAEAADCGVEDVVVITAGFAETGGAGADRERRLREVAADRGLNLVGPNSLGVMSTRAGGLNATFGPASPDPGSVSLLSQSGAFVTAVLDWAAEAGIGFRDVVSLGNQSVLSAADFVREWGTDPGTDVVVGYLESIPDGRAFVEAAREATRETPVVLVKSGRSDAGARAAASHTGAIAGSDRAYEAGLREAGVLRARTVEELFDAARALAGLPLPDSEAVAVVTNAGGPGVLATDAVGEADLSLASFADATLDRLAEALPDTASIHNPVDVVGDADVDRFRSALSAAVEDPGVGAAVAVSAPTAVLSYDDLARAVGETAADADLPVTACLMGGARVESAAATLTEYGVPNYFDPARAVRGLSTLAEYRRVQGRERSDPPTFDVDRERVREILRTAAAAGRTRLGVEATDVLRAYGVPTPESEVVDDPADAVAAAQDVDGDVVMKVVSPDVLHKSDIGGVVVGVPDEEVYRTYEEILARARGYQSDARILGVQVQEYLDLEGRTETILGVNRDPGFGPLVLFGLGGIFVEILQDTAVRLAPPTEAGARAMTEEIRAAPLLRGARGRPPADLAAVVDAVCRVGRLAADFPAILELDVNPLVAGPDGAQAADLRLTIDPDEVDPDP